MMDHEVRYSLSQLPLVSIITPTYNRASFLKETIESVLSQGYSRLEYIVLDDGSTDETRDILAQYNGRVRWETHFNVGETLTVNKAYSMANGDIVGIVNSDDLLLPGAIHEAVLALKDSPNAVAAYPDWLEIDEDSRPVRVWRLPNYNIHNMLLDFCVSFGPGAFIRRKVLEATGVRDPAFTYAADLELVFRLALRGELVHIPKVLGTHRTHSGSASVGQEGSERADELVALVKKMYADTLLPSDLVVSRHRVWKRVHSVAVHYCGSDSAARWKHRSLSLVWLTADLVGRRLMGLGRRLMGLGRRLMELGRRLMGLGRRLMGLGRRLIRFLMTTCWGVFRHICVLRLASARRRVKKPVRLVLISADSSTEGLDRIVETTDPQVSFVKLSEYNELRDVQQALDRWSNSSHVFSEEPHPDARGPLVGFNWRHLLKVVGFTSWKIVRSLRRKECNAVVAPAQGIVTPLVAFVVALMARCPFYLYVLNDYMCQRAKCPSLDSVVRRLERLFLMRGAGVAIVPNEMIARDLGERLKTTCFVVRIPSAVRRDPKEHVAMLSDEGHMQRSSLEVCSTIVVVWTNTYLDPTPIRDFLAALDLIPNFRSKLLVYTTQPSQIMKEWGLRCHNVEIRTYPGWPRCLEAYERADMLFLPLWLAPELGHVNDTYQPVEFSDYLFSGRPILASGPVDAYVTCYMKMFQCGLVVSEDGPTDLAEKIYALMHNDDLRSKLVQNALARAKADFSLVDSRNSFRERVGLSL